MHIISSRNWRWSLTYLINSKKASRKACEIWLKLSHVRGYLKMWQIINFCKHLQTITQCVTITWMHYRVRYRAFSLRLAWFWLFATCYHALPSTFLTRSKIPEMTFVREKSISKYIYCISIYLLEFSLLYLRC